MIRLVGVDTISLNRAWFSVWKKNDSLQIPCKLDNQNVKTDGSLNDYILFINT